MVSPSEQVLPVAASHGVATAGRGSAVQKRSPRINVALTPEQHSLLLELGALQGRSAASYLREMLDGAMPMLRDLMPVLRTAAAHTEQQPQAMVKEAQEAIRAALDHIEDNRDQLNLLEILAGHTPVSASNDVIDGAGTAPSGARADRPSKRASGRKRS